MYIRSLAMMSFLMSRTFFDCLLLLAISLPSILAQFNTGCAPGDFACHLTSQWQFRLQNPRFAGGNTPVRQSCDYRDLWLIPGRADASCSRLGEVLMVRARPNAKKLVDIDARQVSIYPPIIRFPGCFTVEIKNIHLRDNGEGSSTNFFAKSEYQWLNVREFGEVKCQNASSDGCGGFGNNCYYCDVCESLREIGKSKNQLSEQFRGLNCPKRVGYYTFRKEFCFNDWSTFDADGDCRLDFISSSKTDIKAALASLQQVGYGTIVAKIRLAANASKAIERKKAIKEAQIENAVIRELEERRATWDISRGQFDRFQQWYLQNRKDIWHREEYLPWLLYENEIGCIKLTFDICERQPRQKLYDGQGYTCE